MSVCHQSSLADNVWDHCFGVCVFPKARQRISEALIVSKDVSVQSQLRAVGAPHDPQCNYACNGGHWVKNMNIFQPQSLLTDVRTIPAWSTIHCHPLNSL